MMIKLTGKKSFLISCLIHTDFLLKRPKLTSARNWVQVDEKHIL